MDRGARVWLVRRSPLPVTLCSWRQIPEASFTDKMTQQSLCFKNLFYWQRVTLKYCANFCCTYSQVIQLYTCIFFFLLFSIMVHHRIYWIQFSVLSSRTLLLIHPCVTVCVCWSQTLNPSLNHPLFLKRDTGTQESLPLNLLTHLLGTVRLHLVIYWLDITGLGERAEIGERMSQTTFQRF